MNKTRVVGLVTASVMLICSFSGCCSTHQVWKQESVRPRPLVLRDATVDSTGALTIGVDYSNGERRRFTWDEDRLAASAVEPGADTLFREPDLAPLSAPPYELLLLGDHLRFRKGASWGTMDLPRPVDWSTPSAYVAVAITPLALIADFLTSPIHVAWILGTAGGHGDPWLPWCERS